MRRRLVDYFLLRHLTTVRALAAAFVGTVVIGCETIGTQPARVAVVGRFANPEIRESSGVVRSVDQPGVYWTINDSGNGPFLFAFDSAGRDLGVFRVSGARNTDWESLAMAPCGGESDASGDGDGGAGSCLIVGDTGDNNERRPNRTLYRIREPRIGAEGSRGDTIRAVERLVFTYEDRPHDVEGIFVSGDGAVHLVTKGRSGGILQFRIEPSAWRGGATAVARRVDSLPIVPSLRARRSITDAARAADGRHIAVRTYRDLYLFRTDSATGAIDTSVPPSGCNLRALRERNGEGVTWLDPQGVLLLTSEGKAGLISVAACPLPAAAP